MQPGRYRHFKGQEYLVWGTVRHSETGEEMVLYQPDYGERQLWVRPRDMFEETIAYNGRSVPRFEYLGPDTQCLGSGPFPTELCDVLLHDGQLRIERIVSWGHASPPGFWYDQTEHEWVMLLCGAARLRFDDGVVTLSAGDSRWIPAHTRHRVEWTVADEPTVWLAILYQAE